MSSIRATSYSGNYLEDPRFISATVSTLFLLNQTTIGGCLNKAFCDILMFLVALEANLSIPLFENQTTILVHQRTILYVPLLTIGFRSERAILSIVYFRHQTTSPGAEGITSYAPLG